MGNRFEGGASNNDEYTQVYIIWGVLGAAADTYSQGGGTSYVYTQKGVGIK